MSNYDNKDTFVLFPNDKRRNDRSPNMTGKVVLSKDSVEWLAGQIAAGVDEPTLYVAAWERESPRIAGVFLSGSVQPSTPKNEGSNSGGGYRNQPPRQQPVKNDPADDEIPF